MGVSTRGLPQERQLGWNLKHVLLGPIPPMIHGTNCGHHWRAGVGTGSERQSCQSSAPQGPKGQGRKKSSLGWLKSSTSAWEQTWGPGRQEFTSAPQGSTSPLRHSPCFSLTQASPHTAFSQPNSTTHCVCISLPAAWFRLLHSSLCSP